ncbi:type I pullulanase [Lederbergia panacisoli]|uniref:type I pullulanase n=1 Tax=Lederbergia panacisoli TaxID=1255251 RepID=UPI00214C1358|nr:type I pullulanase [Lederbergia panacisoli]MCR2820639.1 type I pullulanase [Lederbergia panacisoli]
MDTHVAWIDDFHHITLKTNNISTLILQDLPKIYWPRKKKYFMAKIKNVTGSSTVNIGFSDFLPMGEILELIWGEETFPVYPRAVVQTKWFDENYSAIDEKLGAYCINDITYFSIWAPIATSVTLYLNNMAKKLNRQKKGVWTCQIDGNWHGSAYEYEITVNGKTMRVNDPYAKSLLANSEKGIVIDFSKTNQITAKRPVIESLQDAIIYELHVRDATIHPESGVKNKGTFLGLSEKEAKTENGFSTGLSYIKDLGFTHIQLLPINDFARVNELEPKEQYNWGYDPLFFQALEGSYSISPNDPISRINECKNMIQSFHEAGLSVILDVVFNHVFIMEQSPFEKLVPGYYFRYKEDGSISNGTGVGNDLATERTMVRKLILDTIDLFISEYQVSGFRFDLMGAIDIETMNEIARRCEKESNPIMLLGEGWDLATALDPFKRATTVNSDQLQGIRFFNDYFRDSLKGNLFNEADTGYVNGGGRLVERLPHLVMGSNVEGLSHLQTINYVECHDNHTLWDRLILTNSHENDDVRKKIHSLATGITLLSQGVPFIHAGQEWFRTKQGIENSYISGDEINQLDWKKRELEEKNIKFIDNLISMRKKYEVFRLRSDDEIRRRLHVLKTPKPLFAYTLFGNGEDFTIYINPTKENYNLQLPSPGLWKVVATNDLINANRDIEGEFIVVGPYVLVVLIKKR